MSSPLLASSNADCNPAELLTSIVAAETAIGVPKKPPPIDRNATSEEIRRIWLGEGIFQLNRGCMDRVTPELDSGTKSLTSNRDRQTSNIANQREVACQ